MAATGSLITTIYLTYQHNQVALAFFAGILISITLAIIRPSRINVALIVGFILLLLGFEYDKHIAEPLLDQTLNSLSVEGASSKLNKLVSYSISFLIPIFMYIFGWGLVFLSISMLSLRKKNNDI